MLRLVPLTSRQGSADSLAQAIEQARYATRATVPPGMTVDGLAVELNQIYLSIVGDGSTPVGQVAAHLGAR